MPDRFDVFRVIPRVFWVFVVVAIVIWSLVPGYVVGWDLRVIGDAIVSLRAGHDPYADALAAQEAFRQQLALHPNAAIPFSYVYAPVTLPVLRIVSFLPLWFAALVYWTVYVVAMITTIWFGMQFAEPRERGVLAILAPAAVFFPGLLQNDVLFSGNVAFILYACVFAAAWAGWRHGIWTLFYASVLVASCVKPPLLTLLVIPVLSARRQWLASCLTGVAGVALFGVQPVLWPGLFTNYLKTLDDMFVLARDFGSSPAGLLTQALYDRFPYRIVMTSAYLAYAIPVLGTLFLVSRKFLAGQLSLKQWVPVLLIGVLLLNPRIIEYDVASVTLLMALVAWRVFASQSKTGPAIFRMSVFFVSINVAAALTRFFPAAWRCTECFVLLLLFAGGVRNLFLRAGNTGEQQDCHPLVPSAEAGA